MTPASASAPRPSRPGENAPAAPGPIGAFVDASAWADWLAGNAAGSDGIWVQIAKKGSGIASVTYAEAVDEALCWGWIDGQRRKFDELAFLQRFTPRRARSMWSQVNCAKALAFMADGRMQPRGLAEVEQARADGRWDAAYASQLSLIHI